MTQQNRASTFGERTRRFTWAAAVAALAGAFPDTVLAQPEDSGTWGEMGNAAFGYRCVDDRDAICQLDANVGNAPLKALPRKLAAGARFGMELIAESPAVQAGSAILGPISDHFFSTKSGTDLVFTALRPGDSGFLVTRAAIVLDFVHVEIAPVDHVRIALDSVVTGASPIEIGVGALRTFHSWPADASGDVLGGSFESVTWTSENPAIAVIMTSPATDTIVVRGGAPGETVLRVSYCGVTAAVAVKVVDVSFGSEARGTP